MSDGFSIENLSEILGRLDALGLHVEQSVQTNTALYLLRLQSKAKINQTAHVDTGRLRSSIQIRIDANKLGGDVYTDVDYGPFVEFGTRFMGPFPFLIPAWNEIVPLYMEAVGKSIMKFHQ